MDLPILYIGLSQSFFAVIVLLLKKPLKIADVILAILLGAFALAFGFDILQVYGILPDNRWVISISLFMLFAPLIYLYSKYVTNELYKFNLYDYLHAFPSALLILLYLILKLFFSHVPLSSPSSEQYLWLREIFGYVFQLLLVVYVFYALRNVIRFKKQIHSYYSYKSDKISLNWLLVVIISFLLTFVIILIVSTLYEYHKLNSMVKVDMYRHIVELFFVYVISIWGFRQTQLNSENETSPSHNVRLEKKDIESSKYQKSGLKDNQAEEYLQRLVEYMTETESWKDNELSVAKLSVQTNIPKHHITQVLNEHLGKNFYLFVNEYRIEYAKKLLKTEKYDAWSVVAIAYECGFNSKTAFNNFFKKYTHRTPSEFRKQANVMS